VVSVSCLLFLGCRFARKRFSGFVHCISGKIIESIISCIRSVSFSHSKLKMAAVADIVGVGWRIWKREQHASSQRGFLLNFTYIDGVSLDLRVSPSRLLVRMRGKGGCCVLSRLPFSKAGEKTNINAESCALHFLCGVLVIKHVVVVRSSVRSAGHGSYNSIFYYPWRLWSSCHLPSSNVSSFLEPPRRETDMEQTLYLMSLQKTGQLKSCVRDRGTRT
jgi:hypothetical protein